MTLFCAYECEAIVYIDKRVLCRRSTPPVVEVATAQAKRVCSTYSRILRYRPLLRRTTGPVIILETRVVDQELRAFRLLVRLGQPLSAAAQ